MSGEYVKHFPMLACLASEFPNLKKVLLLFPRQQDFIFLGGAMHMCPSLVIRHFLIWTYCVTSGVIRWVVADDVDETNHRASSVELFIFFRCLTQHRLPMRSA